MKLNTISACGEYLDDEMMKMKIEDGFDFDITISESQAGNMGVVSATGDSHLCFRILSTGELEGAMCDCSSSDDDIIKAEPVADEYMNEIEDIVKHFRLREMAMAETREKFLRIVSDVSAKQPDDVIMVGYGDSYDKYLQAYDTCLLAVYLKGKRMIEKRFHVNPEEDDDALWELCLSDEDIYRNTARRLKKEYNIRDKYILNFSSDEMEEKLYAISQEGVASGQAEVRRMSGRASSAVYYKVFLNKDKKIPDNLIHRICRKLLKGSGSDSV